MEVDLNKLLPNAELSDCCCAALLNLLPEELQPAMAELALDHLDELSYIPLPPEPYLLSRFKDDIKEKENEWKKATYDEKERTRKKVFSDKDVAKYMEEADHIQAKNLGNAITLEKYIRVWLDWDEKEKARKCWVIYASFPDTLEHGNCVVWRKKKEFV